MIRRMIGAFLLLSLPGTLLTAAYYLDRSERSEQKAVVVAPEPEPSDLHVRTGDHFWGLHLDGVIPCARMLVRGGGHLVILSPSDEPEAKCYFHVRGRKAVELRGSRFLLSVAGDDRIRVIREPVQHLASN